MERHHGEEREQRDDDERPHVVRRDDADRGHEVVPLGDPRNARHGQEPKPDPPDPLLHVGHFAIHEDRDKEEQREDRGDGDACRIVAEGRVGAEEPQSRRPQREGGHAQRPVQTWRDEVGEGGRGHVEQQADAVGVRVGRGAQVHRREGDERHRRRVAVRMPWQGDEDQDEIEEERVREHQVAALVDRVADGRGGHDAGRGEDDPSARDRVGSGSEAVDHAATRQGRRLARIMERSFAGSAPTNTWPARLPGWRLPPPERPGRAPPHHARGGGSR